MSVASLGSFSITVRVDADNPHIMHWSASAETRKEAISGVTNPDENADQFGLRVRGILRALLNSEHRIKSAEVIEPEPKGKKKNA